MRQIIPHKVLQSEFDKLRACYVQKDLSYMKTWMLLVIILSAVGCVGTIEDPNKINQAQAVPTEANFSFSGIDSAVAISHRGFQVSFNPASGGSGHFDYNLYVDGDYSHSIASLASENAGVDIFGKLNIVVNTLQFRTAPYTLVVRARDRESFLEERNTNVVSLSTLGYETPLFSGITTLENVQGALGKSSLAVTWTVAAPSRSRASVFSPATVYDISGYILYYQKQGSLTVNSIFLSNPETTSFTISGLEENTFYSVWLHAKDSQTPGVEDENLVKLSKSTRPDQPIVFSGVAGLSAPTTSLGLSNLTASWAPAQGNFTKYRIFFTTNLGLSSVNPPVDSLGMNYVDVNVTTSNPNVSSYQFPVTTAGTTYRVFVVACDDTCTSYEGESVSLEASTTPPVSPFVGADIASFGVDNVELTWNNLPDEYSGAYDGYQVTMQQCLPPLVCLKTVLTNATLPVKLLATPSKSAKKVKIIGLTVGQNYCFKVESSLAAGGPPTRFYENASWKCGVPQYQQPGPSIYLSETYLVSPPDNFGTRNCQAPTVDGFTVKWKGPSTGTYDRFEVLFQDGAGVLDWNNAVTVNLQPGHDATTQYTKMVTGKIAGTVVQVAVRTVYEDLASNFFYGQIAATFNCTIDIQKVVPQGWMALMAIGLKEDAVQGEAIPESFINKGEIFADKQKAADGGASYQVIERALASAEVGTILSEFSFPAEASLVDKNYSVTNVLSTTDTSQNGRMVRLAWKDFQFNDGSLFSAGDLSGTVGYKVYRMPYESGHSTTPPDANTAGWQLVSGGSVIKANLVSFNNTARNFYQAEFIDYTISGAPSSTDAPVYWYKVEPYIGATKVELVATPGDYIVKMVTPPSNTALAHRWMLNKEACERLGKTPDRDHQYRCPYTGIGSRRFAVAAPLYLDFKGHLLVDRFELGCNFSRAALSCTSGLPNNTPMNEGRKALSCNPIDPGCAAATALTSAEYTGVEDGACINMGINASGGYVNPIAAADGSVYYKRATKNLVGQVANFNYNSTIAPAHSCFYRQGGVWKTIQNAIDTAGVNLSTVVGAAVSNKAGLPPLTMINQGTANKVCSTFSLNVTSPITGNVKTYTKRLPRKQEYVALMAPPVEAENYSSYYESGTLHNMGCNIKKSNAGAGANADLTSNKKHNGGNYGQGLDALNINHFLYPRSNAHATQYFVSGVGPVFATGSQGKNSTAACTFRYGIQDIIGNVPEWSGEKFICNSAQACYPSSYPEDNSIIADSLTFNGDASKTLNFTTEIGPNRTGYFFNDSSLSILSARLPLPAQNYYADGANAASLYGPKSDYYNWAAYTGFKSRNMFQAAPFFAALSGWPLYCQDPSHCDGDSMKYTLAPAGLGWTTTGATTLALTDIGEDYARLDLQAPQTGINQFASIGFFPFDLTAIAGQNAGIVVGGFPCNSQGLSGYPNNMSCEGAGQAEGRFAYTVTESDLSYPDVSARCAVLVEEDEGGSFVP